MTVELTEFLLARITEDEGIAQEATNDGHKWLVEEETISLWPDDLEPCTGNIHFPRKAHAYHAAAWEPARVLAECEAKRRIVGSFSWYQENAGRGTASYDALLLAERHALLLASVYADHPDYRPEWRP